MKKETEVGTLEFVQGKYKGYFIGKKVYTCFHRIMKFGFASMFFTKGRKA